MISKVDIQTMRICLCDYSGHPFQVQLARELARRGHAVLHLYFADFQTPHGRLSVEREDPSTLTIEGVSLGTPFAKYSFLKRRQQEIAIGQKLADRMRRFKPDLVIGCNLPIDSLRIVIGMTRVNRIKFLFWQQDIYSAAIMSVLKAKFGMIGGLIGSYYRMLEQRAAQASDGIVVITDRFATALVEDFKISADAITVIENWAPLDEITPQPRRNAWTKRHDLDDVKTVLYTGTLGMKHDPAKLLSLAKALEKRGHAKLIVTSEGPAASWLHEEAQALHLQSLRILPFQPFAEYPQVLGGADILVSIIEEDAGGYSVPSKVLSYLCAARPIILSGPEHNAAARIITGHQTGACIPPGDTLRFIDTVMAYLDDAALCERAGANARAYAQSAFDIGKKADAFERIFRKLDLS